MEAESTTVGIRWLVKIWRSRDFLPCIINRRIRTNNYNWLFVYVDYSFERADRRYTWRNAFAWSRYGSDVVVTLKNNGVNFQWSAATKRLRVYHYYSEDAYFRRQSPSVSTSQVIFSFTWHRRPNSCRRKINSSPNLLPSYPILSVISSYLSFTQLCNANTHVCCRSKIAKQLASRWIA